MEIRVIRNTEEYKAALHAIEKMWSAPAKSVQTERLQALILLVEQYEKTHFPMSDPDPIALIEHVMESRGLSHEDLEYMIGPRARVADILNRTRPLTLDMIRRLVVHFDLPAEVLLKPYLLRQ